MKILIDTSYFLRLIKVEVEGIPQDLLINLLEKNSHEFYYSELSIFELTAKGLKLTIQDTNILVQDIRIGIDSIINDNRLITISYTNNPYIIEIAAELRNIHKDTIDCLIIASAICESDCIITMDYDFYEKVIQHKIIKEKMLEINNNFKFWFNDLSEEPKSLK